MSGSVVFSSRTRSFIDCGGSTTNVRAGPDTTSMSAVDVLAQLCVICKFLATMALKLSQGGVHFVTFYKKPMQILSLMFKLATIRYGLLYLIPKLPTILWGQW